jgi:plastocyanin
MKHLIVISCLMVFAGYSGFAVTHTITNSGFTFSPDNITINQGDTINFVLASIHNARQVTEATWNANGITSNGGFDTPFGGSQLILSQPGIYYYVCINHGPMGMKGIITVNTIATGINYGNPALPPDFELKQNYPNPFNPTATIGFALPTRSQVRLGIYDILGNRIIYLVDGTEDAGLKEVTWNASNVASGIYISRFEATSISDPSKTFIQTRKMLLIK